MSDVYLWSDGTFHTTPEPEHLVGVTPELHGPTISVTVPPRFYDDHVDRGCPPGVVEGRYRGGVHLLLDREAWDDLLSDADHYATSASEYGPELVGLCSSARATARKMRTIPHVPEGWVR